MTTTSTTTATSTISATAQVQAIIDGLTAALVDAAKHDKGNGSATTRVRNAAQTAKVQLQDLRTSVQEQKASAKSN